MGNRQGRCRNHHCICQWLRCVSMQGCAETGPGFFQVVFHTFYTAEVFHAPLLKERILLHSHNRNILLSRCSLIHLFLMIIFPPVSGIGKWLVWMYRTPLRIPTHSSCLRQKQDIAAQQYAVACQCNAVICKRM